MGEDMIHIAICDDEALERDYLSDIVQRWAKDMGHLFSLATFESGESFLFNYEDNKEVNILLLDIQMKELDGVSLAKKIRETNSGVQIIFITGISDFMSEGYEVSALHYLLKPVKEEKLYEVLNKSVEKLGQVEKFLLLNINRENIRILLKDIIFIESVDHYINIHTFDDVYNTKMALGDFEKLLDERFIRCQRSYIVGLGYIKKVTKTSVFLSDDKEIPISRGMYNTINNAIIENL